VHQAAAGGRGDPAGVAAGRGHLAVERHRRLEGDERQTLADEARERFVQLLAEPVQGAVVDHDVDASGAQGVDTATVDDRVRVGGADHHAGDAGGDDLLGAGTGATVAAARLEGHVQGGALRALAGLLEGDGLGVRRARPAMVPLTHEAVGGHDDRSDARVGVRLPPAQAGELQGVVQMFGVSHKKNPGAHRLQGSCDYVPAVFFHPDSDRRLRDLT
jgi:hypothetical protein